MRTYVLRRLVQFIPVIFGVATLVFLFIHFVPGDPVDIMLGDFAQQADRETLRRDLGLDLPIWTQYKNFWSGLFHLDLGMSLRPRVPVAQLLAEHLPATLELTLISMFFCILISIPVGIYSGYKPGSAGDQVGTLGAFLGVSMPNFWLGPLLIIVFSIHLGWLPVSGRGDWRHFILPAITLGGSMAAYLTRIVRASIIDVLREDYVRTARAKGLSEFTVLTKHVLRNGLIPILTVIGFQFGGLLAGSVITETVFAWPGIGRLTVNAIVNRNYPLVQGCILLISLIYVTASLVTDLLYRWADPRVRFGS